MSPVERPERSLIAVAPDAFGQYPIRGRFELLLHTCECHEEWKWLHGYLCKRSAYRVEVFATGSADYFFRYGRVTETQTCKSLGDVARRLGRSPILDYVSWRTKHHLQQPPRGGAIESLRGKLLISSGGLYDPNFRHTVVLIGEHNSDGALGVVLNRIFDLTVEQVFGPLAALVPPGERLYQGGPVQPDVPVLLAEVSRPDLADLLVFDSIGFLVGDVSADISSSVLRARVYAGYSGWGPGQLEAEMAIDSWIVEPARVEDVFTEAPERLWSSVLQRKGPEYQHLSRMPYDPSVN